jgi:hypothetical protein
VSHARVCFCEHVETTLFVEVIAKYNRHRASLATLTEF